MNAYQPRGTQTYGYGNTCLSFDPTGTLIFGYDASSNRFITFNVGASPGTAARFRQFTGKERDAESGLDYFGARYYGSALGRFSSPDAPTVDQHPADPQSWNLYAYVRNNPLALIDPTGLDCVYAGFNSDGKPVGSIDHNSNVGSCGDSHGTWVPGKVNADALAYNTVTNLFQAASNDGQNVYFETFTAGAQTDASGNANPNLSGGFAILRSCKRISIAYTLKLVTRPLELFSSCGGHS